MYVFPRLSVCCESRSVCVLLPPLDTWPAIPLRSRGVWGPAMCCNPSPSDTTDPKTVRKLVLCADPGKDPSVLAELDLSSDGGGNEVEPSGFIVGMG